MYFSGVILVGDFLYVPETKYVLSTSDLDGNIYWSNAFYQNFIRFQTIEVQNEIFVMIPADCQLYLIFYFILRFYLIKTLFSFFTEIMLNFSTIFLFLYKG